MADKNLENKIMGEIKSGRVKLRSRYIFLAEKLGLSSATVLSALLAILSAALVLLYLRATDNLIYLSFGKGGILAFLESFPYALVVGLIGFIFVTGVLVKKSEVSYKKPFGYMALGLVISILFAGTAVAFTSIGERIENETYSRMGARAFTHAGFEDRRRGVAGRIIEVGEGYFLVQTPQGVQSVDVASIKPPFNQETVGNFLIAVGERLGAVFVAHQARILSDSDMPMVRRDIHRRFGAQPERKHLSAEARGCLKNCFAERETIEICRGRCVLFIRN